MLILVVASVLLAIVLFGFIPLCVGWLAKKLTQYLTGRD